MRRKLLYSGLDGFPRKGSLVLVFYSGKKGPESTGYVAFHIWADFGYIDHE